MRDIFTAEDAEDHAKDAEGLCVLCSEIVCQAGVSTA